MIAHLHYPLAVLLAASASLVWRTSEHRVVPQQCTVSIRPLAAVGNETDALISVPVAVARYRERFFLSHMAAQTDLLVFRPDGKFEKRLGRSGSGPGEFRSVLKAFPWADSLAVFDPMNRRLTIYDSALVARRYQTLNYPLRTIVRLRDGSMLINATLSTAVGMTLHHVSGEGVLLKSFDGAGNYPGNDFQPFRRNLALAKSGDVWAARQNDYRVDLVRPNGELIRTIRRQPRWAGFDGTRRYGLDPKDLSRAPSPGLVGVREFSGNVLVAMVHVPDSKWKTSLGTGPGLYGEPALKIDNEDILWDTLFEVLDARTGAVLASTRLDQAFTNFADDSTAYSYHETNAGLPTIRFHGITTNCVR